MDFLSGGLAGAGATILTNPMDVIKTRMQLQGELRARGEHAIQYRNTLQATYVIAKNDGLLALQKGLAPAMLWGFTMNAIRLGLYNVAEKEGWTKTKEGVGSIPRMWLWGTLGGVFSGMIMNPVVVVKTRLQSAAHPSIAVGKQHKYNGLLDGLATIYRKEGFRGWYTGVNAICWRLGIGSAAQLTAFSAAKEALINYGLFQNSKVLLAFVASCISGVVVVVAICPLDVATIRLFNQDRQHKQLYTGVLDCLRKIYHTEGLHGLYKGIGPLYFRLAPHTTISLVIWDVLNNIFISNKSK